MGGSLIGRKHVWDGHTILHRKLPGGNVWVILFKLDGDTIYKYNFHDMEHLCTWDKFCWSTRYVFVKPLGQVHS